MHFKRMFFRFLPIGFRLLIEEFSKDGDDDDDDDDNDHDEVCTRVDHKIVIYNRKCYYSKNV